MYRAIHGIIHWLAREIKRDKKPINSVYGIGIDFRVNAGVAGYWPRHVPAKTHPLFASGHPTRLVVVGLLPSV